MSIVTGTSTHAPKRESRLYLGVALVVAFLAFGGFTPSYWAPMSNGTLDLHPAIHVHAALFFAWTLLFVAQTVLVERGLTRWHREIGLGGIALASAMVFSGVLATIVSLQATLPVRPAFARTSAALGLSSMALFSAFVAIAIANHRRADLHKRLMVLASFSVLGAAVVRLFRFLPSGELTSRVLVGSIATDVLLLAVIVIDRRSTGRLHPAWLVGGGVFFATKHLRPLIVPTPFWQAVTDWLSALGR